MKQITADEFKKAVGLDPAWASKLTEPVEITDYCGMDCTKISHLSPLLHFTGKAGDGQCASFRACKHLIVAQGNFDSFVDFGESGIRKIDPEKLVIKSPDNFGQASCFGDCHRLEVAEGHFPGFVSFYMAGISRVNPNAFSITMENSISLPLWVDGCPIQTDPDELYRLVGVLCKDKPSIAVQQIIEKFAQEENEEDLKKAFEKVLQLIRKQETYRRKNAAVEIQID